MKRFIVSGAVFLAFVGLLVIELPSVMAAVETASWGEIKQNSLTRPAAKVVHHEGSRALRVVDEEFVESLLGLWESRRFNENGDIELVRYVFEGGREAGGTVTLYQTILDAEEERTPIVGSWELLGDIGIRLTWDLEWEGTVENYWVDVTLFLNEDEEILVLDYNDSIDKELRTLNKDTSIIAGPVLENWRVEGVPESVSVRNGRWERVDFQVKAADGHLPDHVKFYVEGHDQVHILSIPAYYGTEEVPQVTLCGPISGVRWESSRELRMSLDDNDGGGVFVTGCGTARATVNIYAPEAIIDVDEPLATFRVRTGS